MGGEAGPIGVGIIGFGVVGRTHAAAYAAAAAAGLDCRVVGIHSRSLGGGDTSANLRELGGGGVPPGARIYPSADDLLADEAVHAVSVCTHTDSHVAYALRALEAGKHVIVEKPLALTAAEAEPLVEAAERADTVCMPGMTVRFWPGWTWLHDRIRQGTFGELRSLAVRRLGEPPAWGRHFYTDTGRSGGALYDLHVHDVDFLRWCLGDPAAAVSSGTLAHVSTLYRYDGGPAPVEVEGGWIPVRGFPFRMRYRAVFEVAVAEYEHDRDPPLLLARGGSAEPVPIPAENAYEAEIAHFLAAIRDGGGELRATVAEAAAAVRILEAERASLEAGGAVPVAVGPAGGRPAAPRGA